MEANSQTEMAAWLIIYHKKSSKSSVYYEEAVEEALCFGWIDSVVNKRDDESKYQYFAPRKEKSNWSKSNKLRIERMRKQGLMTERGEKMVALAKELGTWDALVDVENLVVPDDLQKALDRNKRAQKNFAGFPPSSKRIILEWIFNAKRHETRERRIKETVEMAAENIRANHYGQK